MQQKEYFGIGSIKNIKDILEENNLNNVFLVTGRNSYSSCGAESALGELLKDYNVSRFYDFEVNPKLEDAERGVELFKKEDYDVIIGIGGGTVIDMAKLIKTFAAQEEGSSIDYVKGKEIKQSDKPLIAVPTTAGSGSEATHFAVVYVDKVKYSLAHEFILPEYSIVDPQFTMSIPSGITASTGMDALGQAIESFWAVGSNDESRKYATQAISLIMDNLAEAVNNTTENSRIQMIKASNFAGKAINISKTTAPHAISYAFTSYFGIPHGHAVGLTLGKVLEYNSAVTDIKDTMEKLYNLLDVNNAVSAKNKINNLMKEIGLETNIYELGIKTKEDIALIADNVNVERLSNNPRPMKREDLINILEH